MDGDGHADLIWQGATTGSNAATVIWYMNGAGVRTRQAALSHDGERVGCWRGRRLQRRRAHGRDLEEHRNRPSGWMVAQCEPATYQLALRCQRDGRLEGGREVR
jgi:hypothetical protein